MRDRSLWQYLWNICPFSSPSFYIRTCWHLRPTPQRSRF